jgi:hypothetical protein
MRDDEHRDAEAGILTPAVDHVVHRAADDPGATGAEQELLVDRRRRAPLAAVAPGAAEDPVVQPLAALAEARAGSVVRTGDVAVQRYRDPCELVRP